MKTTHILMLMACLFAGCEQQPEPTIDTATTVIIDRTDSLTNFPTVQSLTEPLDLKHNQWQGVQLILTVISDKDVNERTVITLEKQNQWSGDIVSRGCAIKHFLAQVQHCLDSLHKVPTCNHSIIYRTIAREANILAASGATAKLLLIYSNLYENNGTINLYDSNTRQELRHSPKTIEQRLVKTLPLNDVSKLHVWVLYSPLSFSDNNTFMNAAGLYQHLFETHGATVHIATTFSQP